MAALASGDLADAARALRASTQQISRAQAGSWMAASAAEERAADELTAVARALSALENEAVLDAASQDIAAAAASTRAPPVGDPALLAREAQAALEACLRAAERLAVETSADPRRASLLDFVRRAAESFREAVRLATEGAAAPAAERLAEGRALLDQASSLAAKMREEAGAGADAARTELAKNVDADKDDPSAPSSSKELEAAYSELDRILELERAGKEVAAQLEQLFASDPGADPARTEAAMHELEEKMEGGSLSTAELVELIAKLVAIDRDGREAVQAERALAADAEKLFPHADGPPNEPPRVDDGGLRALADGHTATAQRVRNLAARLRETGFKLSAVLPNVLKAYWQATAAVEPALRAVDAAGDALARSEPPQRLLLDAASHLDDWLNGVGAMRRQALEAVADAERGTGSAGANSAHSSLERARQSLAEAARLGKSGDAGAARRLGAQSLRSIADAAGLLRARISELTIPAGDEGRLLSRVLDEEAASLGLGWSVLTRGSAPLDAARLGQPAPGEMPFPASYREWVKVYLQALTEE